MHNTHFFLRLWIRFNKPSANVPVLSHTALLLMYLLDMNHGWYPNLYWCTLLKSSLHNGSSVGSIKGQTEHHWGWDVDDIPTMDQFYSILGCGFLMRHEIWRISSQQLSWNPNDRMEAAVMVTTSFGPQMFAQTICLSQQQSKWDSGTLRSKRVTVVSMECSWYVHLWDQKEWSTKVNSSSLFICETHAKTWNPSAAFRQFRSTTGHGRLCQAVHDEQREVLNVGNPWCEVARRPCTQWPDWDMSIICQ